jgi:hypothetical protein
MDMMKTWLVVSVVMVGCLSFGACLGGSVNYYMEHPEDMPEMIGP